MSADAYLEALAHFKQCDVEVTDLATAVKGVGNQLDLNRARFGFSNTPSDLPAEAFLSKNSASFDANEWPDAPRIMAMLAKWHKARDAVRSAWANVPENLRSGLVPPTDSRSVVMDVVR